MLHESARVLISSKVVAVSIQVTADPLQSFFKSIVRLRETQAEIFIIAGAEGVTRRQANIAFLQYTLHELKT